MNSNQKIRRLKFYKNYFKDFYDGQRQKVKEKIIWTFRLIEEVKQVPDTYFKHMEGMQGLYEIRVQAGSDIFRIFCFFDESNLIVVGNAYQKKTQKTPSKEIEKALKIKAEYEAEK
ncbi:MAG: type II toxin-antitoxin system RelE/ParE family toxin [Rufibacter sp.]